MKKSIEKLFKSKTFKTFTILLLVLFLMSATGWVSDWDLDTYLPYIGAGFFGTPIGLNTDSTSVLTPGLHELSLTMIDNTNNFQPGIEVERHYTLNIPPKFNTHKTYDVVFYFHGLTGNVDHSLTQTKIASISNQAGFIAVIPQGMGISEDYYEIFPGDTSYKNSKTGWNTRPHSQPDNTYSYATERHPDDDEFINLLISQLDQNLNINRIFVMGFSNGCGMAQHIAYTRDDIDGVGIGGCGIIGGDFLNYQQDVHDGTKDPFSILLFHATADKTSTYMHLEDPITPGEPITAEVAIDAFANVHECDENPFIENFPIYTIPGVSSASHWTYLNCNAKTEFYGLEDGEHEWYAQVTPVVWKFLKNT